MYSRCVGGVAWRASTSAVTASITCSSSERVPLKSKISARKGMAGEPSDRGYSARHDRPPDTRRCPAAASAGHALDRCGRPGGGWRSRRRHRSSTGTISSRCPAIPTARTSMLDGAGGDGRGDQRVQIGCLVAATLPQPEPAGRHGPHVDHISGGRFILGIGAGWNRARLRRVRLRVRTAASRLRDLDRGDADDHGPAGEAEPGPVQDQLPILIGGNGEKVTLRIVAQYATIWNGRPAELARHKCAVLDARCRRVGRDPSQIERSIAGITTADPAGYSTPTWTPASRI